MQITAIRERTVRLEGSVANAVVDFSRHTVSLVALVSDQVRDGEPLVGYAFNSIGRFGQRGILTERLCPRLLEADPAQYCDEAGRLDPARVLTLAMRDEKPGGHGDRAGAAAALELAAWDLAAKLVDEPTWRYISRCLETTPLVDGAPVYAAGGYYYAGESRARLAEELKRYRDQGYDAFKIKIGGASIQQDLARIETAIDVAGDVRRVAVDANGRFDLTQARRYAAAIEPYGLRWYEEPGDPLDYALMAELAGEYRGALATGENLFSSIDATNLLRYAGMRGDRDILQMDPGLSYGLTEYLQTVSAAEGAGFKRTQCIPHGGHLINLHIVTALGLGGCEAYPGVFQPFGGYSPGCRVENGRVWPSEAPGFGLEEKGDLVPHLAALLAE